MTEPIKNSRVIYHLSRNNEVILTEQIKKTTSFYRFSRNNEVILTEPTNRPQQYANQETIDLANQLLPTILERKTKLEIVEILEDPENQNLVDLLRQFCNQTYKSQIYRNNGGTYCCYQVKWENVGKIRNIDPRNMWNLNYLLFTTPNSANLSMFIFTVLYVVKLNLRGYLRQTLNSQGYSYCTYTGSIFPL